MNTRRIGEMLQNLKSTGPAISMMYTIEVTAMTGVGKMTIAGPG